MILEVFHLLLGVGYDGVRAGLPASWTHLHRKDKNRLAPKHQSNLSGKGHIADADQDP